jgi:hypothetical protein
MGRAVLLAVALCCFVVGNGRAATQGSELTLTDADLLKACTQTDYEWMDFCNDYIQAAFDATGSKGICAPEGVPRNQLFDIIVPRISVVWTGGVSTGGLSKLGGFDNGFVDRCRMSALPH